MYGEDEAVGDLLLIISALTGFIFWAFNDDKVFLSILIIFFMNIFLKIIKHKYGSKISYVLNTPILDLFKK